MPAIPSDPGLEPRYRAERRSASADLPAIGRPAGMRTAFNTVTLTIARPRAAVWDLFLDRARWLASFRSRDLLQGEDDRPGALYRITSFLDGSSRERFEEVIAIEPTRRLVVGMWIDESKIVAHGDFLFGGDDERTRLTVSIHSFVPDSNPEAAAELQALTQTRIGVDFARLRDVAEARSPHLESTTEGSECPADPFDFLYPEIDPAQSGYIETGEGHSVWWESNGSPSGVPVLFVHGGPGAPTRPMHRRFFDPSFYRFVTLHQRGCGKSRPLAETNANDTQALIADFERLRVHLGIERWLLAGGSWGSCLALAYGERHPDRCLGFVLIGVTLGRTIDREWWWNGTRMLFPDAYDALLEHLPSDRRNEPQAAFYERLMDTDPGVHVPASRAVCAFSAATVNLEIKEETVALYRDADVTLPLARLALHYFTHNNFLRPNQILEEVESVSHLPLAIVIGRYDVTTQPEAGWTLHKAWPHSDVKIVQAGAHSVLDPLVAHAFLDSIEAMKGRI